MNENLHQGQFQGMIDGMQDHMGIQVVKGGLILPNRKIIPAVPENIEARIGPVGRVPDPSKWTDEHFRGADFSVNDEKGNEFTLMLRHWPQKGHWGASFTPWNNEDINEEALYNTKYRDGGRSTTPEDFSDHIVEILDRAPANKSKASDLDRAAMDQAIDESGGGRYIPGAFYGNWTGRNWGIQKTGGYDVVKGEEYWHG